MQRLGVDRAQVLEHAHCERCGRAYADEDRAAQKGWTMTLVAGSIEGFRCPRHEPVAGDEAPSGRSPARVGPPSAPASHDETPALLLASDDYRAAAERAARLGGIGPGPAALAAEVPAPHVFVSAYVNPDGHHLGAAFRLPAPLPAGTEVVEAAWLLGGANAHAVHLELTGPHLAAARPVRIRGAGFGAAVRARTREHAARIAGLALPE